MVTGLGFAVLAAFTQSWWLVAVGLWTAMIAAALRKLLVAAHQFRPQIAGAPDRPEQLSDDQRVRLYETAARTLTVIEERMPQPVAAERRPKLLATYMYIILDRAIIARANVLTSIVLVLAYVASCALLWPLLRQL